MTAVILSWIYTPFAYFCRSAVTFPIIVRNMSYNINVSTGRRSNENFLREAAAALGTIELSLALIRFNRCVKGPCDTIVPSTSVLEERHVLLYVLSRK